MDHADHADNTEKMGGESPRPGNMKRVNLRCDDLALAPRRQYAAQLLLAAMGDECAGECLLVDKGRSSGLSFDGGPVISDAELDEIAYAATLQRELATGRIDDMGMFDENAIGWDVSKPWIDRRAGELAGLIGCGELSSGAMKRRFRVLITHDVDRTSLFEPTMLAKSILQSIGFLRNHIPLATALGRKNLSGIYERLLECERRHGVGACFFMLSGPHGLRRYSSRCDIRWAASRDILRLITQAGMTVGLHGSYYARERNGYKREKDRLEQALGKAVTCHRNHYLRFDPVRMWSQLEAAGIRYDFSVGFNYRLGFRAGCGNAYRGFDLQNNRMSGVISIPMLFMDGVLFRGDRREILRQLRRALEEVRQINGCVSLLFHPELLILDPEMWHVFEEVLCMCKELGADMSGQLPWLPAPDVETAAKKDSKVEPCVA